MDTAPNTSAPASSKARNLLRQVQIATPCTASWDQMLGDERMRFCNQCNLNVYNLSAMTDREAEDLLLAREGRLCVRLFRRADGTVVTQDCPKALERIRRRMRIISGAVAGALAAMLATGLGRPVHKGCATAGAGQGPRPAVSFVPPVPTMGEPAPVEMGATPTPPPIAKMGKVALPRPPVREFMGDVAAPVESKGQVLIR